MVLRGVVDSPELEILRQGSRQLHVMECLEGGNVVGDLSGVSQDDVVVLASASSSIEVVVESWWKMKSSGFQNIYVFNGNAADIQIADGEPQELDFQEELQSDENSDAVILYTGDSTVFEEGHVPESFFCSKEELLEDSTRLAPERTLRQVMGRLGALQPGRVVSTGPGAFLSAFVLFALGKPEGDLKILRNDIPAEDLLETGMVYNVDIAVIGGGAAGLSAALALGRSLRKTVLFNCNAQRNLPSAHANGVFTRDHTSPSVLYAAAKADLERYSRFVTINLNQVQSIEGGWKAGLFQICTDSEVFVARKIVLATGVVDQLPDVAGLAELWGKKVFHCPYCHGFEVQAKKWAILLGGPFDPRMKHFAPLLQHWASELHVFVNGTPFPEEVLDEFKLSGIFVNTMTVLEVRQVGDQVALKGDDTVTLDAIFIAPTTSQRGQSLIQQLGCDVDPHFHFVSVGEDFSTSVRGVFAAGDMIHLRHAISAAASQGYLAGASANNQLILDDYEYALDCAKML